MKYIVNLVHFTELGLEQSSTQSGVNYYNVLPEMINYRGSSSARMSEN